MTISDVFRILRKHIITVLSTGTIVFLIVVAFTFLSPIKYTATAELFATYSSQTSDNQNSSEMSSGASYLSTQIQTYPKLVKTEAVLKPVIDELGLDMSVSDLADMVTATNPTNTFMVDISVESRNAKQSSEIANSVAKNLANQISSSLYTEKNGKSPINLSVVQQAQIPQKQSSPKIALYLAAGFVLAVMLSVIAAILKDTLNTKVESLEEIREFADISSLGIVPRSEVLDRIKPIVIAQPASAEAEEFRRMRSNIGFLNPTTQDRGHLIVIASTQPAEGKTTIAVNVAAALAEDGKTVLLVDCDLRHPSIASKLGIEGGAGLSHVLSGQAVPRDVVQAYWKKNLHILPAGKRPANASILLGSELMKEVLEQALRQYDYVLLDTAPLEVSNDAAVFGRQADGIVLVVGKGVAEKKELKNSVISLGEAKIPILGFILNFANPKKIHSDYYYYQSSGTHKEVGNKSRK